MGQITSHEKFITNQAATVDSTFMGGYFAIYDNLVANNTIRQPVLLLICKSPSDNTFLAYVNGKIGVYKYANMVDNNGAMERNFLWAYYPTTGLLSPFSDASIFLTNPNNTISAGTGTPDVFWKIDLNNFVVQVKGTTTNQVLENGGSLSQGSTVVTYTNDNNWTKKWAFYILSGLQTTVGGSITDITGGTINMIMHSACPFKYDNGLTIASKCQVVIMDNASTGNALSIDMSTTPKPANAITFNITRLDCFLMEYDPVNHTIRPCISNDLCLINDGTSVRFEYSENTRSSNKWILDLDTFAVKNMDTGNCIENGGLISAGSNVAAYPFDNKPNKKWSFHIYNCLA